MIAALALLGYAAAAAWGAPVLLAPLTRRGASVGAGLTAWLAAMASVLAAAALAVQFSVRALTSDWPRLTQALCQSVAGNACTPGVYRGLAYQVGVAALAALLTVAAAAALYRYGRRVRRSRAQTRSHAQAALLVGRSLASTGSAAGAAARPAPGARTVVLDDPRPAAYCVAGRPAAIVVTSGALAVLDPAQLRAVLEHERAHLAGRHHALATVVRALAATFGAVPLFARGDDEVTRLTEMAADDAAARSAGRPTVAAALLALAMGRAVPAPAGAGAGPDPGAGVPRAVLAAAAHAVPARVDRLLAPSGTGSAQRAAALLALIAALLVALPALLSVFAG